jgi:hypothetical protein
LAKKYFFIAQSEAQPIFGQNQCITLNVEKASKKLGNFGNFQKTLKG